MRYWYSTGCSKTSSDSWSRSIGRNEVYALWPGVGMPSSVSTTPMSLGMGMVLLPNLAGLAGHAFIAETAAGSSGSREPDGGS